MRLILILFIGMLIISNVAQSQHSVGIGVATPNKNAVLELVSPESNQGLLVPRLTTVQRTAAAFVTALSAQENGLLVYDQTEGKFYFWDSTEWQPVGETTVAQGKGILIDGDTISVVPQDLELIGNILSITNNPNATPISLAAFTGTNTDDQTLTFDPTTGQLSITRASGGPQFVNVTASGSAGGDFSGNYPNPTIGNDAITSAKILDGTIVGADIADGSIVTADLANLSVDNSKIASGVDVGKLLSGTLNQVLTTTAGGAAWANLPATGTVTNISTGTGLAGGPITASGTISLANTAVAPGTYGTATEIPRITVDAQGRLTSVLPTTISGVLPGGTAAGDLTGSYPNPVIANDAITTGKILDGTVGTVDLANLSVNDSKIASGVAVNKLTAGTLNQVLTTTAGGTAWSNLPAFGTVTNIATGTGLTGGPISAAGTISLANTAVAPGTYGSATEASRVTVDAQGRLTAASAVTISGTLPGGASGGDLTGNYPSPTVANNAITSAKIADGTIVNADVSATAALAVAKFSAGANGEVLTTAGGVAQWATLGANGLINDIGTRNLNAGASSSVGGGDNAVYGEFAGTVNTGNYNVIMGTQAAQNKVTGDLSTIIGWYAGNASSHHQGNTFIGAEAGRFTSASVNVSTFVGEKAGYNHAAGTSNVMIGERAGQNSTAGDYNVIVGTTAANANVTGNRLTLIGRNADVIGTNLTNATALGESAIVDASNKVRIGNTAVTVIQGQVPFTNASDRRLKSNIHKLENGLDLILNLRPVSYTMLNAIDTLKNWGFIAQEVESLVGKGNAIVTTGGDAAKTLGLRYTDLIAPLVKAVQEQQAEIEKVKAQLISSEQRIQFMEEAMMKMQSEKNEMAEIKNEIEKMKQELGMTSSTK